MEENNETGGYFIGPWQYSGASQCRGAQYVENAGGAVARLQISGSFVEVAEPTLEQEIGRLAEQGVERIVIVPMFLTKRQPSFQWHSPHFGSDAAALQPYSN